MMENYLRFLMNILSILLKLRPSLPEIMETFKDHPSIMKIFSLRREECQFKFHSVNENEVRKVILAWMK